MFQHLRHFSAISLVLIITIALIVGTLFKRVVEEDIAQITETNNAALAQSFVSGIWRHHAAIVGHLARVPSHRWGADTDFYLFSHVSNAFFASLPIEKANLYLPDNSLILSSAPEKILHTDSAKQEGATLFKQSELAQGRTVSRIIEGAGFYNPAGKTSDRILVHTIVPIMSDPRSGSRKVEGFIEIFYDITDKWADLSLIQWVSAGGIIVIFLILIAILFYMSQRAESIIAKQHEVNLELTAAAASAEAESRDKAQFLANISHELRTPLNAIIGFSEILKNEIMQSLSDTHQSYIKDINNSGTHLLSLINDILDYSKAEAGKLELVIEESDITKLIKNSMRLVIPRAEEAQVTLVEELPSEHVIIATDSKKLKQVLLNLLSNAVKFTPAGGEVKVSIWPNVVDHSISIEVKDTGIGIAPKNISKVMTPFGQVDSTLARKYEGTGLGLPLSKKFIESMHGEFKITSELDVGTTITITLPESVEQK